MKKLLIFPVLLLLLFSCKEDNNKVDLIALKKAVNENQNYLAYKQSLNEIMLSGLNGEVSFKNANRKNIKNKISKLKTLQEFKDLYQSEGIIGGDKLAQMQYNYSSSLALLLNDFPELKRLSKSDFKEVLDFNPSITNEDIENSAKNILKSTRNK